MVINNKISIFVATFIMAGFIFIALPDKGNAGISPVPGGPPCCDVQDFTCVGGADALSVCQGDVADCSESEGPCEFFDDAICMENVDGVAGRCVASPTVPTLSVWGLIAMAGFLGIIGFIVIRRGKATV